MASSHRLERINGKLLRDLSLLIANKVKDNRVREASVSVTRVKATPDLKDATVYVSIIGTDKEKKEALNALKHASGFLRSEIAKGMKTYQTPALNFVLDDSVEYGARIDSILEDLRNSGQISDTLPEDMEDDF